MKTIIHLLLALIWILPAAGQESSSRLLTIFEAAEWGDVDRVRELLPEVADINLRDSTGYTALHYAAMGGHIGVLEVLLLDPNLNLQEWDRDNVFPLKAAIDSGHIDFALRMLDAGAKAYIREDAITVLHDAVEAGGVPLVNKIVSMSPALFGKADRWGRTPLHLAAGAGRSDLVEALLDAARRSRQYSDKEFKTILDLQEAESGRTALHLAVLANDPKSARLLVEAGAAKEIRDRGNRKPGHIAKASRFDEMMGILGEGYGTGWPLLDAVGEGDLEKVKEILNTDPSQIDVQGSEGWTALNTACLSGNLPIAQFLLEKGAKVDLAQFSGFTPLHSAAMKNRLEIVRLLLGHGASLEARTNEGLTPLVLASVGSHLEIMKEFQAQGAVIDSRSGKDTTPLHSASASGRPKRFDCSYPWGPMSMPVGENAGWRRIEDDRSPVGGHVGYREVAEILLDAGADAKAVDALSRDAMYYAIQYGHTDIVKVLLEKGVPAEYWIGGGHETPLRVAVNNWQIEIARLLLEKGAKINVGQRPEDTPLGLAIRSSQPDFVRLFKEFGAQNTKEQLKDYIAQAIRESGSNFTETQKEMIDLLSGGDLSLEPDDLNKLFLAAVHGKQLESVTLFLEKGADVNYQEKEGSDRALHSAGHGQDRTLVRFLLNHGADPNATGFLGQTPIYSANDVIAEMLIEAGARLDVRDNDGNTPLHEIARSTDLKTMKFFLDQGQDPNAKNNWGDTPLHRMAGERSSNRGFKESLDLILQYGAEINALNNQGETALTLASSIGNEEFVRILKEAGAKSAGPGKDDFLRLANAVRKGDIEAIRALLEQGLSPNASDEERTTALHLTSIPEMIQLLLDHGANIDPRVNEGRTPLLRAAQENQSA
jgi:serine/threonine-protein phosphatase 6 regulatory ankyrin repeat subunit B